jgi:PAS domain S-box-containing protein
MINHTPVILSSKVTIGEAIAQITNNSQRYAVVMDQDFTGSQSILGILTETVILKTIATVPNWQNQAIADITPPHKLILDHIPPDPTQILKLLQTEEISYLIVIDSEKNLVGILSEVDLLKHILANPPERMQQISQKIIEIEKQNLKLEAQISDRTKSLRHINQELLAEISERKLATVALRESEDKFRHIFEDSPMGISLLGLDGKYIQVNPAYCQMLGYTESELKKLSIFEITHSHNIFLEISLEKDLMGKIEKGTINQYHLEKSYIKKDQQTLRVNQTAATIRDSLGKVRYFINMVEDISDRNKAAEDLRQSEERFRKIFEDSPIGMAILGLDQKVIKVNAVLSQMLGYPELEIINQSLNFLTHPQDQPASDRLAQYLYNGQLSSYQLEKRCIRKNQQIIWVALNASVVKDQDGQILHVLIMIRDITKQKASQELISNSLAEKEILLQEIHHRVKNNLHVIASLLELQARSTNDEHIINLFTDSQNRIHSMALIHEQLCLSPKFEHIDFEQYLRKLIGNLFSSYGVNPMQIKCIFDVEPVSIRFQTAIPCGLILNEIVSNSLKYAFQGCDRGEIRIQLRQQPTHLNLVISDNGIGIPPDLDWHKVNSLGLRLVRILTKQIDGNISLDGSQGTSFSLSFAEVKSHNREYACV